MGIVSPLKVFPHLFPQNLSARANTSGERTINLENCGKLCFASKTRFFFSEIIELASLRHCVDYSYVLAASGERIGHPLRQNTCPVRGIFLGGEKRSPCGLRVEDSKGLAYKPNRGLQYVGESHPLRQNTCPVRGIFFGGEKRSPCGLRVEDSKIYLV